MKDNFSKHSDTYVAFRPTYPYKLGKWLASQCANTDAVWDCATGNGQMATVLADHFTRVIATDLSANQIQRATPGSNIEYRCEPAHQSSLSDHSVDAVVIAQAIHWFDFEAFYREVRRVVRPGGIIAAVGYGLLEPAHPAVLNAMLHFYSLTVGPYWDPERRYIDEEYTTIPFPFEEIPFEEQYMTYHWDKPMLLGFLRSWSAVQHYINKNGNDPVDLFEQELDMVWPHAETVPMIFKIIGRIGRV